MLHQEKKYRVESFDAIEAQLGAMDVQPEKVAISTHYYGEQDSKGVTKLVTHNDRNEIHILNERDGQFTLREKLRVKSKDAGLDWLREHGFQTAAVVKMAHTDYSYKDGIIGLYLINDFLYSVILDFPKGKHEAVAKRFNLDKAEVIPVPYNHYLAQIGHLQSIQLI